MNEYLSQLHTPLTVLIGSHVPISPSSQGSAILCQLNPLHHPPRHNQCPSSAVQHRTLSLYLSRHSVLNETSFPACDMFSLPCTRSLSTSDTHASTQAHLPSQDSAFCSRKALKMFNQPPATRVSAVSSASTSCACNAPSPCTPPSATAHAAHAMPLLCALLPLALHLNTRRLRSRLLQKPALWWGSSQ